MLKKYEGAALSDIMQLTMNQILLLNHASSVNYERSEEYYEWKRQFKKDEDKQSFHKTKGDVVDVTQIPSAATYSVIFGG